jgi:hypothetical protein
MNTTVPTNVKNLYGRYNVFGIVLVLVCLISVGYLWVVRRWWFQATTKERRGAML